MLTPHHALIYSPKFLKSLVSCSIFTPKKSVFEWTRMLYCIAKMIQDGEFCTWKPQTREAFFFLHPKPVISRIFFFQDLSSVFYWNPKKFTFEFRFFPEFSCFSWIVSWNIKSECYKYISDKTWTSNAIWSWANSFEITSWSRTTVTLDARLTYNQFATNNIPK